MENMLQTVLSMKMLKGITDNDGDDLDLGKLVLMQSLSSGEPIQVTDVLKAKLVSKLNLDGDEDSMSLDKVMLLQMLEEGEIDVSQIVLMKMIGKMFGEEDAKKSE